MASRQAGAGRQGVVYEGQILCVYSDHPGRRWGGVYPAQAGAEVGAAPAPAGKVVELAHWRREAEALGPDFTLEEEASRPGQPDWDGAEEECPQAECSAWEEDEGHSGHQHPVQRGRGLLWCAELLTGLLVAGLVAVTAVHLLGA